MQIVLRQTFPLGRFHATPWGVNPFDDPHGEWPPSPWRLVRAITARWYQWAREANVPPDDEQLEKLIAALCGSHYAFHIPELTWKGSPARQYFPTEFGWNPKEKKKSGTRSYSTSLAQDNYWCMARDDVGTIWWSLDGGDWDNALLDALDRCLERITYFGRAESFTRIQRASEPAPKANCKLTDQRNRGTVPVLVPRPDAKRNDVEKVTGELKPTTPPGARLMYALRPPRPPAREKLQRPAFRPDCTLLQFAIGWNVAPRRRVIVRLTSRFRGAVILRLARIKSRNTKANWRSVSAAIREVMSDMTGKDSNGKPLVGPHRHTEFLVWCEDGMPTRILIWRDGRPFDEGEQMAIFRAAARELSWTGNGPDSWRIRLIPLECSVPPPPGFDGVPAQAWESLTPYVPPRHHLRNGKPRPNESVEAQIRRELKLRGLLEDMNVSITVGNSEWVATHLPRWQRRGGSAVGDSRGYWVQLRFPVSVHGPLRLGHSSSFGLGLFRPAAVRSAEE